MLPAAETQQKALKIQQLFILEIWEGSPGVFQGC
jgi:hypothetical protein